MKVSINLIEHELERKMPFHLRMVNGNDGQNLLIKNSEYISIPPKDCPNRTYVIIYNSSGIPSFFPLETIERIVCTPEGDYSKMKIIDAVFEALGCFSQGATANDVETHIEMCGGIDKGKQKSIGFTLGNLWREKKISRSGSGPEYLYARKRVTP